MPPGAARDENMALSRRILDTRRTLQANQPLSPQLDSTDPNTSKSAPRRARRGRTRANEHPKRTRRRGGNGGGRSGLRRVVYWSAVVAVWLLVAFVGLFAWVAFHLPSIHSLEIPRRPPSIQIVSADGKPFAMRG